MGSNGSPGRRASGSQKSSKSQVLAWEEDGGKVDDGAAAAGGTTPAERELGEVGFSNSKTANNKHAENEGRSDAMPALDAYSLDSDSDRDSEAQLASRTMTSSAGVAIAKKTARMAAEEEEEEEEEETGGAERARRHRPLFAFDAVREGFDWGRPKRRLKTTSRYDPTESGASRCRVGHGFACPGCSAISTYDSTSCKFCGLECRYEAGVGVVVMRDRRISYAPYDDVGHRRVPSSSSSPPRRRRGRTAKAKAKANDGGGDDDRAAAAIVDDGASNRNDGVASDHPRDPDGDSEGICDARSGNIFATLKARLVAADDGRVGEAAEEWARSTIALSEEDACGTTSSDGRSSGEVVALVEKACQALLYASRVRGAAEAREREISRLEAERDDAVARSTSLEQTVRELRSRIEILKSRRRQDDDSL